MIIRSVEFHCYGPFTNRTFEFRRGLNVVYGPNESGKTTLMDSVAVALYGSKDAISRQSWGLEGDCRVTLLLEGEGSSVRLNRDLPSGRISFLRTDDMYRTRFRFEGQTDDEDREEEARQFADQLQDIFGLPGADEFRDILTLRQQRDDPQSCATIPAQLLALCRESDDKTLRGALGDLEEEYLGLTRSNPWGEDRTGDGPLEQMRHQLEDLEQGWYSHQKPLKELAEMGRAIAAVQAEIDFDESELAKGEHFLKHLDEDPSLGPSGPDSRSRELQELDARFEKVDRLLRRREELGRERAALGLGENPDYDIPALAEEAEQARRSLHDIQNATAQLRQELISEAGPSWIFPSGATGGFFLLAGALAYWRSDLTAAALFSACLLSLIAWVLHFWVSGSRKSDLGAKKERMLGLDQQREKAQERLGEIDQRLTQAGLPVSASELEPIREQFVRHREIEQEMAQIDSALDVLEDPDELEAKRQQLRERICGQNGEDSSQADEAQRPENIADARQRLEEFRQQLDKKKSRLADLNQQMDELVEQVRGLRLIEKDGEILRERETRIRHRLGVLSTAHELLQRIDGGHEGGQVEKLANMVGRYSKPLTGGRHRSVRIDADGQLMLKARGGQWEPLSRFGRSTLDSVGLALRMALIDHFFPNRSVPLLLDEPLVNLDHKRMSETLKQLETMATHHQVILFSHQEAMLKKAAKAGWNLITLSDRAEKRGSRAEERSKDDEQQLHLL